LGADGDMGILFGENEDDVADHLVMNSRFVGFAYAIDTEFLVARYVNVE
jgi:hypothetical protein